MLSRVISMRFQDHQVERLGRLARRLGRTPSEASVLLVEEALREEEFGYIDFRNSPAGRQAYVKGTTLAVWEIARLAQGYGMNPNQAALHLRWPLYRVQAALQYAEAFPEEIQTAIDDNAAYDFERLSRMLPGAEEFVAGNEPTSNSR